jgi:hypothetical protein
MAGQPPEPSFQPSGQDQALTQGRPAWQQPPSYTPPAGAPGAQQGYGAPSYPPQDQAYTPQEQAYPAQDQAYPGPGPEQAYPGQDQTYTSLGQGQDYQGYQGYQPPSYGAQQGQGAGPPPPQWQGIAGVKPAAVRTKKPGEKGFLGSLFDFSFTSMITPKVVKALYALCAIMTLFGLVIIFGVARALGHSTAAGWIDLLIFGVPFALVSLGVTRLFLEAAVILFRIHDELKAIREQGNDRA